MANFFENLRIAGSGPISLVSFVLSFIIMLTVCLILKPTFLYNQDGEGNTTSFNNSKAVYYSLYVGAIINIIVVLCLTIDMEL